MLGKELKTRSEKEFAREVRKFLKTLEETQILQLRRIFHYQMPLQGNGWGHFHYKSFIHDEMFRRGMLCDKK